MSASSGTLIALATRGLPTKKVMRVTPYASGGFAVMMPYHAERSGYVMRMRADYSKMYQVLGPEDVTHFVANDRVKLSYHADGFAQFSGERAGRILSGRDPITGEARGVGLMTQPLSAPIATGPTCGLALWGLDTFHNLESGRSALIFTDDELYYRNCTDADANGWLFETFVFPKRFWAGVRRRGQEFVLSMGMGNFQSTHAVVEMKCIDLPGQDCFLAMFGNRVHLDFEQTSGWTLNGPGRVDHETGLGEFLMAMYPADPDVESAAVSLDWPLASEDGA